MSNQRLERVRSRLHDETRLVADRQREKFDPSKHQAKWADNMAGAMVRTTGRAMVNWMKQ